MHVTTNVKLMTPATGLPTIKKKDFVSNLATVSTSLTLLVTHASQVRKTVMCTNAVFKDHAR